MSTFCIDSKLEGLLRDHVQVAQRNPQWQAPQIGEIQGAQCYFFQCCGQRHESREIAQGISILDPACLLHLKFESGEQPSNGVRAVQVRMFDVNDGAALFHEARGERLDVVIQTKYETTRL